MTINEYTPTTEQVREKWAWNDVLGEALDEHEAEFDRWLAVVRREARAAGIQEARELAEVYAAGAEAVGRETGEWWNPADVAEDIRRAFVALEARANRA
jgi:hypothetical protein